MGKDKVDHLLELSFFAEEFQDVATGKMITLPVQIDFPSVDDPGFANVISGFWESKMFVPRWQLRMPGKLPQKLNSRKPAPPAHELTFAWRQSIPNAVPGKGQFP